MTGWREDMPVAHKVTVTLPDVLYQAAARQADEEDRASSRSDGVASLARHALRQYLNKRGYKIPRFSQSGEGPRE